MCIESLITKSFKCQCTAFNWATLLVSEDDCYNPRGIVVESSFVTNISRRFLSTFGIPAGGKRRFRLAWFKACLKSISFFQDILKEN